MKRSCGVLLPVASLPSKYGIGCFSTEAYRFIDFLKKSGQSLWQILPLGQTGYGDSPYQSISTFAGNAYFIDLEQLIGLGYITEEEASCYDFGSNPSYIDYSRIYQSRYLLLHSAYENSPYALSPKEEWAAEKYNADRYAFQTYVTGCRDWIGDYALYSALKGRFENIPWTEWDEDIRLRRPDAMEKWNRILQNEVRFYCFLQYMFFRQWKSLKEYANKRGIQIVGDVPIYVAMDSADTWSHPELFKLDKTGRPTVVAGCPPDAFAVTGQLWGNPIYNWERHRKEGFAWWKSRMEHAFFLYDTVRIDHFRGFESYYEIPAGEKTAVRGTWMKGPGMELFDALAPVIGKRQVIAEDLGFLTPEVHELLAKSGFPGMKVLQFAFDATGDSEYQPHNFVRNCVVYTGVHDNDTSRGWIEHASPKVRDYALRYLGVCEGKNQSAAEASSVAGTAGQSPLSSAEKEAFVSAMIRAAMMSVADTCIIPIQDYLFLGSEARINTPSTLGDNWTWRVRSSAFTPELARRLRKIAEIYARI